MWSCFLTDTGCSAGPEVLVAARLWLCPDSLPGLGTSCLQFLCLGWQGTGVILEVTGSLNCIYVVFWDPWVKLLIDAL